MYFSQSHLLPGTVQQQIAGQQYTQSQESIQSNYGAHVYGSNGAVGGSNQLHTMPPPADKRYRVLVSNSSASDSDCNSETPKMGFQHASQKKSPLSRSIDQCNPAIYKVEAYIDNYLLNKERDMENLDKARVWVEKTVVQLHRMRDKLYEGMDEPKPIKPIDSLKQFLIQNDLKYALDMFEVQQQQQQEQQH